MDLALHTSFYVACAVVISSLQHSSGISGLLYFIVLARFFIVLSTYNNFLFTYVFSYNGTLVV